MKTRNTVLVASACVFVITTSLLGMLTKITSSTTKQVSTKSYRLPAKNIFNTKKATSHEQRKLLHDLNDRNDTIICDLEFEKLRIQDSIDKLKQQQDHAINVINSNEPLNRDFLTSLEAQLMIDKITHTQSILLTE